MPTDFWASSINQFKNFDQYLPCFTQLVCLLLMGPGFFYLIRPHFAQAYFQSHNISPAIYTSWSGPNSPIGQSTGYDVVPIMSQVWTNEKTINWQVYETQIAGAQPVNTQTGWQKQPISLVLPPQNLDLGGSGTASNPFNRLFAPSWAQSFIRTIQTEHHTYQTWDYGKLTSHVVWLMGEAGKKYNQDPRIGVIRLYLGFQGETQPIKDCQTYWQDVPGGCQDSDPTAALKAFAADPKYCREYMDYIFAVGQAAVQAFPNKPVIAMAQTVGCPNYSGTRWRRELYDRWQKAGVQVGYSSNSLVTDWSNAEGFRPNDDWSSWLTYKNLSGLAPLSVETAIFAFQSPSLQGMHTYWAGLVAQSLGATSYFSPRGVLQNAPDVFFTDWQSYAQNNRVSVVLRDREQPGQSWDNQRGSSGLRGNLNIGAHQTNITETPQACGGAYQPAQNTFNQSTLEFKERACLIQMPTFSSANGNAELYNWQARFTPTGGKFSFQTDVDWTQAHMNQLSIILATEQAGQVELKWDGQSRIITTPAGSWQIYTENTAGITNLEIVNKTNGKLYLHRVDWLRDNGVFGDGQPTGENPPDGSNCSSRRADINCDGLVDLQDYSILLSRLNFQ
ncbi:MAG: hypothetical protein ABIJ03_01270 [Patescibacteria group bacterium]